MTITAEETPQTGAQDLYDDDGQLLMTKLRVILVALACLITLLLALLDINIVSAVSWKIVADLDPVHGVSALPWLTACYALADCIVVPLYGKIADVYGPKPVFMFSLVVFIVGSALCGVSQNMTELIAFRTLQGVGAGGLTAIALIIMGILFRAPEDDTDSATSSRTAFGAVMFGVGLALGPTLGGFVSDSLNWRWVFYINLPFAIAALVLIATFLKLPRHAVKRKIDYLGAALLAAAASCLLLVADWGGQRYSWASGMILALLAGGVLLLGLFVWRSIAAPEPLLSLSLLGNKVFRIMMPITLLGGLGLAGSLFYISGYLQVGRGLSSGDAGLLTLCMAGGMMFSVLVARLIVRLFGKFKWLLVAAGVLQSAVLLAYSQLTDHTRLTWVGIAMFIMGIAMGQSLGVAFQFTQNAVPIEELGIATTSLRFNQQLGTSFGFALFSTIVARYLSSHLSPAAGAANVKGEFNLGALASLTDLQRHAAVNTFISATDLVFLVSAILALVPAVLAIFISEGTSVAAVAAEPERVPVDA